MVTDAAFVAIVDDDEDVRAALVALCRSVDIESRAFADLAEFEATCDPQVKGCVVLDLRLPGLGGLPAIERVGERFPGMVIISVSGHADARTVVRALRAGVFDFFDKPFSNQEMLDAVQAAIWTSRERLSGGASASANEVALLMRSLTRKQRAVVELYAAGAAEAEIAAQLDIHPRTIQRHLQNALDRLQLSSADRSLLALSLARDKNAGR